LSSGLMLMRDLLRGWVCGRVRCVIGGGAGCSPA
jgi:hypothetical protein